LVFLVSLVGFLALHNVVTWNVPPFFRVRRPPTFFDWGLCASCLAFLIAYYRVLALVSGIFPPDPRRRRLGESPTSLRRPTDLVTQREAAWFLVVLPLWAALAQLFWRTILPRPVLDLPPELGHAVLLGWLLGAGLLVASAVLAYL